MKTMTKRRYGSKRRRAIPVTVTNIAITRRFASPATALALVAEYTKGTSIAILATKEGASFGAVRNLLVANRVPIKPRGRYAKATAGAA